jgi:hypothetical protein
LVCFHTPFKRIGGEELQGFGKFFALKKPWKAFDYSDSEFFFGFIGASFGGDWLPEPPKTVWRTK